MGIMDGNAVDIFNKRASDYQEKFMDVGLYGQSLDAFCSSITKENPELLELACGPGNITKYLLDKRPDFKIFATDLAPNMVALAKANNPQAQFTVMDCMDIATLRKKYDAVMCGFCLPYLSKAESAKLIAGAAQILNPNGVMYISTMEENAFRKSGIESSSKGDRMYMNYHRADDLADALSKNGFEIVSLERQDYPEKSKTTDLIIIARKP